MPIRGIRGAAPVASNTKTAIHTATRALLRRIVASNRIPVEEIAGVMLTATPDLNADFPAYAARGLGWHGVPLLCAQEIDVPGAMKRLVRALLLVNTDRAQREMSHVYIGRAAGLRPDLTGKRAPRRR
jgi:chorismate mutase